MKISQLSKEDKEYIDQGVIVYTGELTESVDDFSEDLEEINNI